MRKAHIIIGIIFSLAFMAMGFLYVHAQTTNSNLIITWEAVNFYPSNYQGRAGVSPGTEVIVSATHTNNNQLRNLSQAELRWYVDGRLYQSGVGLKEIAFNAERNEEGEHFIRVVGPGSLEGSVSIPVVSPQLIIESPFSNNKINRGQEAELEALPYFFNVNSFDQISFTWQVDGQTQDENSNVFTIRVGSNENLVGKTLIINAGAVNINNPLESTMTRKLLTIR